MDTTNRVLKIPVLSESIRVEDPVGVQQRREREAVDLLKEAKKRAEGMVAESFETIRKERQRLSEEKAAALAELEQKREEFLREIADKAYEESEVKFKGELKPRLEKSVSDFEALAQTAERTMGQILDDHRNEMVDLSIKIASWVVGDVAEKYRDLVKLTAMRCIDRAKDRQEMVVRVHPEDLDVLKEFELELIRRFDDLKKLRIEPDRRVDRGGVWIETPSGFIDGRIGTQLKEIIEAVLPDAENPQRLKEEGPAKPFLGEAKEADD